MIPGFTPWLALNIVLFAFLLGFGWSAGCWLWAALIGAVSRPRPQG